jgi:hypothetical protein
MKIKEIVIFKDGGTIMITTDKGVFSIDNRLFTSTKGKLFFGYPKDDNKNIINDPTEIRNEILDSLDNYKFDEKFLHREHITKQLLNC